MGLFDLNNPLMRSMEKIADLIILNFFFLLCCIPIVTIGPAFAALYSVTLKLVRNEEGSIVKSYFRAFRLNLKQGILIHLLFLAIAFIVFADIWFVLYSVSGIGAIGYVLLGAAAFLGVMAAMTLLYIYPVLAQFDNSTGALIKASWVLAFRHWPTTLILAVLNVIPIAFVFIPNEAVIAFLYLMLILGFSTLALACSFFLRKAFDQYSGTQETGSENEEMV